MKLYLVSVRWDVNSMYGRFHGEKFVGVYSSLPIAKKNAKKALIRIVDAEALYCVRQSKIVTGNLPDGNGVELFYAMGESTASAAVWAEQVDGNLYE